MVYNGKVDFLNLDTFIPWQYTKDSTSSMYVRVKRESRIGQNIGVFLTIGQLSLIICHVAILNFKFFFVKNFWLIYIPIIM